MLKAYPARFRQRFGQEMSQVFRTGLREAYHARGTGGIIRLWLFTLWDWTVTALKEQISSMSGRDIKMDTLSFDRQLGDVIWMMVTGLRSGYSLLQVFDTLSQETPEPSRSAFKQLFADLRSGLGYEVAFANLQKTVPSRRLDEILEAIKNNDNYEGGMLPELLDRLSDKFLQEVGSDPAMYEAMRTLATWVQAKVPERAK